MNSQTRPDDGTRTAGETPGNDGSTNGSDRRSPSVCSFCQQPFERDRTQGWRGEPVHPECGAALRCGIALGEPSE